MSAPTTAHASEYRYTLTREWAAGDMPTLFVMLNPSTADETTDDPTIRRCIGFACRERSDSLTVVNLYGLRSTRPEHLWEHPDPVGPDNDSTIARELAAAENRCGLVVVAWGANAHPSRVAEFIALSAEFGLSLMCLGTTKQGAPRHPLYVRGDQPLIPWPVAS